MENCTTVFSMLSYVCKYPLKMRMDSQRNWGFGLCYLYLRNIRPTVQPQKGVPGLLRVVSEHVN